MKKIISYILTITIGMAFLIVALGPDRMNPILSTLFGVEKPEPLPPISVPGAEGVAVIGEQDGPNLLVVLSGLKVISYGIDQLDA